MIGRSPAIALTCIAAYFLFFALDGVRAYFTGDDAMNLASLHGLWTIPYGKILQNVALIFTSAYRPMGGLFYRTLYALFGFHPMPFRIACLLLMAVNLLIVFRIACRLTHSIEISALTTLICSYHAAFVDLFYNTGTVYDLLCFLFYAGGFLYYISVRQRHAAFLPSNTIVLTAFVAAAIESKEMALTFPLVLILYELSFHRQAIQFRAIFSSGILVCVYLLVNLFSKNPMSVNPLYQPHFSPVFILNAYRQYYDILFYAPNLFTIPTVLALWAAMLAPAIVLRNQVMAFGLLFSIVTIVPVAVIPPRPGFVLYMPFVGLGLYFAAAIARLRERTRIVAPAYVFGGLLIVLGWIHHKELIRALPATHQYNQITRGLISQMGTARPKLHSGAIILFTNDPYPAQDWIMTFLIRLYYNDPAIWVDRAKVLGHPLGPDDLTLYDYIFAYTNGRLSEERAFASGQPAVRLNFSPRRVRAGQPYVVSVPELARQTIEIAFTIRAKEKSIDQGVMRPWCTLDATGQAHLLTPNDQMPGRIYVTKIRAVGATWKTAEGFLEISDPRL